MKDGLFDLDREDLKLLSRVVEQDQEIDGWTDTEEQTERRNDQIIFLKCMKSLSVYQSVIPP